APQPRAAGGVDLLPAPARGSARPARAAAQRLLEAAAVTGADLKAFVPFADLSEDERAEVAELLEERSLSPGETLFIEGEEADALVLVAEGTLQVESRRTRESARLGPGSVLGGLALFTVGARETSAAGAGRAEVLLLRR